MKKYVKPTVEFESFSLATDISASCALTSNSAPMQCAVPVPGQPGLTIFTDSSCAAYVPGYEDRVCYHVPMADQNVFDS